MSWTLAEHLVDSIMTALQAGMTAKLNAIDTELNAPDDLVLKDPVMWVIGEQDLDRLYEFPAVFVLADQATWDNFRQSLTIVPEIVVRIGLLCEDIDPSNLRRKAYRYGRAMLEIVTDAKRAGTLNGWQPINQGTLTYSPILARDSGMLIDVTLEWTFTKSEDR